MLAAKVFENGRSQAVRLPKEYRFHCDEVMINKIGDVVILLPKNSKWDSFITAIDMFKREKNYEIYVGYKYMHIYNKEQAG